jgi:hypothetical protein
MQLSLIRLALILFVLANTAHAKVFNVMNSTVRGLGMGDAYTALAYDSSALFYNPAGLARVSGINWKIFSLKAGGNDLESYESIIDLQTADTDTEYAAALRDLYGSKVWAGVGAQTAFTAPMFGIAIYENIDLLMKIDNPVNTQLYTSLISDYGYVAGLGVPISPFMHWGFDLKYVKRSGARDTYGSSFIADLDSDVLMSRVTQWGRGYGVDSGVNFFVPTPVFGITLSAVWKNIGQMNFRSNDPDSDIPGEDNDVTVAAAFIIDTPLISITPAIEFRSLNSEEYQLTRKINVGVEIDLPIIDLRAGFREGYYTYGVGVDLGLFRVDAASYAVELGAYPGQIEDRRYVAEFTLELGFGGFQAGNQPESSSFGDNGGGGSSGSGANGGGSNGSKSIWGSKRRLKQRR